jgi:dienelactone hydrolase
MAHSRRMLVLAALVAAAVVLTGCLVPRPPGNAPLRYRDVAFGTVTVTKDLQYGSAVNQSGATEALKLDLYQPTGDTRTSRPAIVFVHGGGFYFGDKGQGVAPDMATEFAKRGYVAVSINYRLGDTPCGGSNLGGSCVAAAIDAQHDAQAAVRWLRANAGTYKVDATRIGMSGESAGGVTSTLVGLRPDDPGTSGNPEPSSAISGFVSISGGVPDGVFASAGDAPGLLFHGDADTTVPLSFSTSTTAAMEKARVPVFLQVLAGAGHVPYGQYRDRFIEQADYFFYLFLDDAHAQGQPAGAARAFERMVGGYAANAKLKRYVAGAKRLRATHTQFVH